MRSYLSNPKFLKAKVANSQSPIQKKRLLEFATHNLKTDKSMQGLSSKGNLNSQTSNSTKVIDFRREIERRYQNSFPNQTYVFPRKVQQTNSSSETSFESLKELGEYDLHSQDFKKSVFLEKQRDSSDPKDKQKNKSLDEVIHHHFNSARDLHIDSKLASNKSKMLEPGSLTSRDHLKGLSVADDSLAGTISKKSLKMVTSKSQKSISGSNSKQKKYTNEQIENQHKWSHSVRNQTYKLLGFNASPKKPDSNLEPLIDTNNAYKDLKEMNNKQKLTLNSTNNIETFMNCNFFPKTLNLTHNSQELRNSVSKSPNYFSSLYKNLELKTLQVGLASNKGNKGATSTSTTDKSASFKSSYSLVHNDTEKALRHSKTQLPTAKQEYNITNNGSYLSSQPREDLNSSRGESQSQRDLKTSTLYQKMQHDILQKLKISEKVKEQSPPKSLHKLTPSVQPKKPIVEHDQRNVSKQKMQSPKVNNFFSGSMANFKILGPSMISKDANTQFKSSKDLHSLEKGSRLSSKETSSKSKTKEDEIPKYLSVCKLLEKCEDKAEKTLYHKLRPDKTKMKLNLHGIAQRSGPYSDRVGGSSDRSEQKNKSHAEYFR